MSIRRNTLYNLAGAGVPAVVTLVTVPLYLGLIGEARYGILAIVWLLLGYFGLFDLGLGRATAQRIAQLSEAPPERRTETFWTALVLNCGMGVVGALVVLPLAYLFFGTYFDLSADLKEEAMAVVPWIAAAVPVATLTGVLSGALQGRECFLALNSINVSGTILFQLLPLLAAWYVAPDLRWLVPAALVGRVVTLAALSERCARHVPLTFPPRPVRALVKPLFRYGGWISVTAIVGPLMVTFDRFFIGAIAGPKAVTWYTVPYNLVQRGEMLPQSLMTSLFPRFAAADNVAEREKLTRQAVMVVLSVMTPVVVAGIIITEPFIMWWINTKFATESANIGHILAIGLWANALARIPITLLQSRGRPDLPAKAHLFELIPYLAGLIFALQWWGIVGAAVVWSLRVTIDAIILFYLSDHRVELARLALPALTLGSAAVVGVVFPVSEPLRWLVGGAALSASVVSAWRGAPPSLRAMIPFRLSYT
ncbi:flippase [Thiohalorhabdus denitrificans]|uniref:Membrane protein involved in the export of O-antigen and teichoic acid n=1 Tax=Thiohalorhabdus denitrificans TaxID=381306 RepID=A0A1G5C729_9GAMM|nr:flippase [Thiohalorhabdus denitrificans]SCX98131.1 Membrane protein involved in the export of O-antigen and teichoic acid [Thiohalorhabdus denitrificans]